MNPDLNKINASLRQAVALHESGKVQEALEIYEEFNQRFPNQVDILSLLGTAQYQLGDHKQGMQTLHAALKINPFNPNVYNNLGNALRELNLFEDAVNCYDIAIKQKSDYAHAYNNRGLALKELGRTDEALISYEKAIALDSDYAEPYNNMANIYADQKDLALSLQNYDKAIAINPQYANAFWNKSLLRLLNGEYEQGWKLYEWRWKVKGLKFARSLDGPLWLGQESLTNKTIFVYAEQGLGDTIQFVRYLKPLKELGAQVIFEVQAPLLNTFFDYEGVSTIKAGDNIPQYDFQCPLLSLPLAFNTTLETIPNSHPYIRADPHQVAHWKAKLGLKTKLRIGLVWSGGFRPNQPEVWAINKRRNIALEYFKAFKDIDADFYSLQKGIEAEAELVNLVNSNWGGPRIIDHTKDLQDFSDTAALIANLDLVVSVDTSTAHMAGALGKPVWILNKFDNCWRWLIHRQDSPWYPSARLFRQEAPGDWESVITQIHTELQKLTEKNS